VNNIGTIGHASHFVFFYQLANKIILKGYAMVLTVDHIGVAMIFVIL